MPWAKLDENFPDHPKVVGLTDRAFRIYVTGLCYSSRVLTDGVIPRKIALGWGSIKYINELVAAELWSRHKLGYSVHDYLEYNPSRADWRMLKRQRSLAGSMGAAARWGDGKSHGTSHSNSDGTTPGTVGVKGGGSPRGGNGRFVHPLDRDRRRDEG